MLFSYIMVALYVLEVKPGWFYRLDTRGRFSVSYLLWFRTMPAIFSVLSVSYGSYCVTDIVFCHTDTFCPFR